MIEIEGPDGVIYEFPEGTDDATMQQALQRVYGAPADQQRPSAPDLSAMSQDQFMADQSRDQLDQMIATRRQGGLPPVPEFTPTDDRFLPPPAEPRGQAGTFARSMVQGATLGAGDEIIAGITSALSPSLSYGDALQNEREGLAANREENPWTSFLGEVGGGIALPGATIGRGAGWLKDLGRSALAGMGYGGAYAFNSGEGVSNRLANVPVGVALGAVGGLLAVPLTRGLSALGNTVGDLFRRREFFRNGALTDQGRSILQRVGVDPDQVTLEFQRTFARDAARAADPADAARASQMGEFGIPAYRHNVTGSVDDFATFERARRGGMGAEAAQRIGAAGDDQMAAVRRAGDTIARDFSGGATADQGDAAAAVMSGLRGARDTARDAGRAAYEALESAGGGVRGTAVQRIGSTVRARLATQNLRLDGGTPNANAAINLLDDTFAEAGTGSVPFMSIERARQRLGVLNRAAQGPSANGLDGIAMQEVVGAFDDRIDEIMTTAMTEGDEGVIGLARNARALWSEYRQTFTGRDAGSKFVQRMLDDDASPDQAVRWLFSAGKLGGGSFTSTVARQVRNVLGEASEEWNAVRQAAFRHMIQKADGMTQPGPQDMSSRLTEFLNGPATRDLSRTLFSGQEIGLMARFSDALKKMIPPPGAVNYSGTAYEGARMARQAGQALMRGLAFTAGNATAGGPVAGMLASGVARGAQAVAQGAGVRNMLHSGIAPRGASVPSGAIGAGVNALATMEPLQSLPIIGRPR